MTKIGFNPVTSVADPNLFVFGGSIPKTTREGIPRLNKNSIEQRFGPSNLSIKFHPAEDKENGVTPNIGVFGKPPRP